jgi:hypothetical protein
LTTPSVVESHEQDYHEQISLEPTSTTVPIVAEGINEMRLETLKEVQDCIQDTQKHLRRVPVVGILSRNAVFNDDEYLGDGEVALRFNQHGIRAFCQRIGFRFDQLSMLEAPSLASQVINDLIQQAAIKTKLDDEEFVLDERTNTIIGMVSSTYVGYGNEQFLADVLEFLSSLPNDEKLEFGEAYSVNTELTLRWCAVKRHGIIRSHGSEAEDRTRFGLDFKNSMVGTSAVRVNYFLWRLVCANGMMVPAGSSINRVFHSGNRDSFKFRLGQCFREVMRKIDCLGQLLETLGAMRFEPQRLAGNGATNERIFEIIPALKEEICAKEELFLRYPPQSSEASKRQMRVKHDARVIGLIPKHYGGQLAGRVFQSRWRDDATVFDFVNVFTEYAKNCTPSKKLAIEEKAGELAKYIAENKRKF